MQFRIFTQAESNEYANFEYTTLNLNQWYCVANVFETNENMTVYVDKVINATNVNGFETIYDLAGTSAIAADGGLANFIDVDMDEVMILNKSLSPAEIEYYCDKTDGFFDKATGIIRPNSPTFSSPTPSDGQTDATQQTINMSCNATLNYYLWFGNTTSPSNIVLDNTTYGNWTTNVTTEGTYYYRGACYNKTNNLFSTNTSERTWIYDVTFPTISATDNFTNNKTIIWNWSIETVINFSDNIQIWSVNITYANGTTIFNETDIGVTFYNYNLTMSLGDETGSYINVSVCDAHTKNLISPIDNFIEKSGIKYKMSKSEWLHIYPKNYGDYYNPKTTKLDDRYIFTFNKYSSALLTETYVVESSDKIEIPKLQLYGGHLIVSGIKDGFWIDFENTDAIKYEIKKINDYKVEVIVYGLVGKTFSFASVGELNCISQLFYYGNLNPAESYTSTVDVTEISFFYLNVTWSNVTMDVVNATFFYNGTEYNYSAFSRDNGNLSFEINVTAPSSVSGTSENMVFFWSVNVDDVIFNLSEHNQTVNVFALDNCTLYNTTSLNISLRNVSDDTFLEGGTINSFFSYWSINNTENKRNYSNSITDSNHSFCIYPNNTILVADILFDYTVGATTYEYSTFETTLNDVTKSIILYATSGTTRITLSVKDTNDNPVENAYIKILKFDVGTNTFKTIEIVKTNDEGEAIANLVLNTVWYKFIIDYNGITYLTTPSTKIFSTTKDFIIDLLAEDWFANYDIRTGVSTSLTYNNATNTFSYTFNDPSSTMHYACLRVVKRAGMTETEIDDQCLETVAGTILVTIIDVEGGTAGKSYIATGYLKFDTIYVTDVLTKIFPGLKDIYNKPGGKDIGLLISLMLIMTLMFVGIWHPSVSITLMLVGVFFTSVLGLWYLSAPWLMAILISGIIVLFRLKR